MPCEYTDSSAPQEENFAAAPTISSAETAKTMMRFRLPRFVVRLLAERLVMLAPLRRQG
jgi:hypothetical protein